MVVCSVVHVPSKNIPQCWWENALFPNVVSVHVVDEMAQIRVASDGLASVVVLRQIPEALPHR